MENKQEDIVMAHRYLYYIENEPVISDMEYDALEREARKHCEEGHPLTKPGSSLKSSYSEDIINLAKSLKS